MSTVACACVCQGQAGQHPERFLVLLTPVVVSAKVFELENLSLDLVGSDVWDDGTILFCPLFYVFIFRLNDHVMSTLCSGKKKKELTTTKIENI